MPFAGVGLTPAGQPTAVATLTVGISEFCGAGSVAEGPKVCWTVVVYGSSQAASGSAKNPIHIASKTLFRIFIPCLRGTTRYNTGMRRMFTAVAMKFA
jgi:hypothetical protein